VRYATAGDRAAILNTISRAFFADPLWSWVFLDPYEQRAHSPARLDFFLIADLRYGSVQIAGASAASAIWTRPGSRRSTTKSRSRSRRSSGAGSARVEPVLEGLGRIDAAHPAHAGHGIGVALLGHHLGTVDAEHLPAYLESSNPANLDRYVRLGFEPRDDIRVAADGPVVTTMWRPAR
jgi:GNAT superfamily N-acetyltransferase